MSDCDQLMNVRVLIIRNLYHQGKSDLYVYTGYKIVDPELSKSKAVQYSKW